MPNSKLTEQAEVGLDGMDREHALELQMVRSLEQALIAGDRCTVLELMGQLEDFANAHFLAEQLLMRLHAYPGYAAHQMEHDRLIAELQRLSTHVLSEPQADAAAVAQALERWMITHIQSEDAALALFLRQPARPPEPA